MKQLIAVVALALIAITITSPSFAKEAETPAITMPKIVRFTTSAEEANVTGDNKMYGAEKITLQKAEAWIAQNYKRVRIISHSVTGNYYGGGYSRGFSTVTILYEEK